MTAPVVIDINGNLIPQTPDVQILDGDADRSPARISAELQTIAGAGDLKALKLGGWQGRDVSSYDGASFAVNLAFYISKVTESRNFVSGGWAARKARIKGAGRVYGEYHYAQPGDGAAQADFFLSVAGMPADNELPVWLDYEVSGLGPAFRDAFCNRYKLRTGVPANLYTYLSMWRNDLHRSKGAAGRLWLAQYGVSAPAESCDIWQWQGGPDLDTAYTALSAMTVGASRKPIPVVTGPPGVYPFGPDGRKPTTSTHTVARNGDTWRTLTDRYFHGGATTSPKAIEQWHLTHGGDPRAAKWQNLGTLTIILPVGSPGFLA